MKTLLSTLIGLSLVGAPNAYAASNAVSSGFSDCACVAAPVASSATLGKILGSTGDVLYSGASGYQKGKSGSPLLSGSEISVGENASAQISVGCQ
jgi:hypothetical protein